jgi:hypothetical protein
MDALSGVVGWARMQFKPQKSRSLVISKGKVTKRFTLKIQNEEIPSIVEEPVKCLGKWFDASLKDHGSMKQLEGKVKDWLGKIDCQGYSKIGFTSMGCYQD